MRGFEKCLRIVEREALKSAHRFKLGAAVIRRGKILGLGHNHPGQKTHPESPHPFNQMHAEFAAILDAKRRGFQLNGASMLVVRMNQKGFKASYPCTICLDYMKELGLKRIGYIWSGALEQTDL